MNNEIPKKDIAAAILALAPHIKIVHHLPGRIRLKVLSSGRQTLERKRQELSHVQVCLQGVRKVRFNPLARSLAFEYDPEVITDDFWTRLVVSSLSPDDRDALEQTILDLIDPSTNGLDHASGSDQ